MRKLIPLFLVLLSFFPSFNLKAQDLFSATDLSTVKVDYLTDADISKIRTQLQVNNLTIEQARAIALAKGMPAVEFSKLRTRLEEPAVTTQMPEQTFEPGRTQETVQNNKKKDSITSRVFGTELFDNPDLNFEPNLKLATPVNYILGPGDELQVSVFGIQEYNATLPVTVEGTVNIQNVGHIQIAGLPIEAATSKIKSAIARIYSTVRSGQSKVVVSLGRIRTIKVTIIGSRLPGNYSVSSLATVYNALYLAGGPAVNGSFRSIELIRDNKVLAIVDIYKFLVNGDQSDNIGLKDNDVIRIPAYNNRVTVDGQVKRPGIFEMKEKETFRDLLRFTSGFTELAYTASVNVVQKTPKEFKVKDLKSAEFDSYQPSPGDVFKVAEILKRFENRITIAGAVFRPDTYSFYEGMRVSDLITQADGLKEDAYTSRATIVRVKSDLSSQIVNVDLSKAVQGDATANILLKREDRVKVYSVLDFKDSTQVTINGEIKNPGEYEYRENLTLNDLLIEAGGLMGSASKRVEIARMIQSEEVDATNSRMSEIFNLEINAANNEQTKNFELKPFDVINVRRMGVYEKPQSINVKGAVSYPGIYVLANKNEKVLDVVNRAGGLTDVAEQNGVRIRRPIQAQQIEALENVNVNLGKNDSVQTKLTRKLKEEVKFATIPVEWDRVIKNPQDYSNITLQPGDEIEVAIRSESVKVQGSVLLTSEIPYIRGKNFNYYLNSVGGVDDKAWTKKAYIIYPNGKAAVTTSFLFFRFFPKVTAGSQIVIPEKPQNQKVTVGEIVSIASVLVGMAGVVIAVLR